MTPWIRVQRGLKLARLALHFAVTLDDFLGCSVTFNLNRCAKTLERKKVIVAFVNRGSIVSSIRSSAPVKNTCPRKPM